MTDEIIVLRFYCYRCAPREVEIEFAQKELDRSYNPSAKCGNCGKEYYLSVDFKGWVVKEVERELER